ncbi:MAG: hypothetical protein GY772_00585, partial [bacterium]|nr:hypothetical protein [bacterium]
MTLVCCTFSCAGDDDDAGDSGRDGDTSDAADSARDSGRDAPGDVTSDPGFDSFDGGSDDPGWQPMPGFPEECTVHWARYPERLLTVEWEDCGPGCQMLAEDERMQRSLANRGWHDGERGYFVSVQSRRGGEDERVTVLAATDGTVFGAWRDDPTDGLFCGVGSLHGSNGHVGFVVGVVTPDTTHERVYHAPLDGLRQPREAIAIASAANGLPAGNSLSRLRASDTTVAARAAFLGEVCVFEGGEPKRLGLRGGAVPGSPQGAISLIDDHVMWNEWVGDSSRISHGSMADDGAVFHELP